MLIRPGSKSGPNWMRNISESLTDPERTKAAVAHALLAMKTGRVPAGSLRTPRTAS